LSTVDKALDILELFSDTRPSLGLSEAARQLDRDKATTLRYLTSLESKGFIEQDPLTRSYHLGPSLVRLAMIREATYPVNKAARNILKKLVEDSGETAHLSHFNHDSLTQIAIEETAYRGTRVYMDPAEKLTLHATASGIAYLSQCSDDVVDRMLSGEIQQHTAATIIVPDDVKKLVQRARRDGFSVMTGTFEADICGIAAPVFGPSGAVCGAVAVATPVTRISGPVIENIRVHVIEAAHRVSKHYGAKRLTDDEAAE
jgi:IclR family transcriptional regulator, acetate operon repressor